MRILLEAAVGIQLDNTSKGKCAVELFVCAACVYRVVCFLCHGGEEPVHLVFVCWWLVWVVVCHHSTDPFKLVNMTRHIGAVNVANVLN